MIGWFQEVPGRLYVVATLLPLAAAAVMAAAGLLRGAARSCREGSPLARSLYWLLGGDKPLRAGAYLAIAAMAAATVLAFAGLFQFLHEAGANADQPTLMDWRWAERAEWARVGLLEEDARPALALELGYRIDHLTAVMFAMVALVSTCIFVFSLGYMREEADETVTDHEVTGPGGAGHLRRRGRFGRFFLYLSLFAFSMLNLVIADNLFQVFVSWELVGVCSFFLIGFYYERPSAGLAANKAFIMNRVGDAGFLVGLAVIWVYVGTFNFQEIFQRLRSPESDSHTTKLEFANEFVRVTPAAEHSGDGNPVFRLPELDEPEGSHVALFPLLKEGDHFHGLGYGRFQEQEFEVPPDRALNAYGAMPYWVLVLAGLGVFLGCVGKSAQFPLHTWLPDAMEGPTPVSALIHAATMVAAGVYLVGRSYPLFAPEVLLVIAYIGAITLFLAATIALVMTDIKRVLAYSTVSQLGFMMLALGVGGWVAGLLHLLTHAFFKALLFLAAGSVIIGCHHEQDMRKMGGLFRKMPVTALTMLVGVLAIIGTPFFSGWYSKDLIIGQSMGYGFEHRDHLILFLLPLGTAALTAFYMFRLWFLTFTGSPRDGHVHEHARESPPVMTVPLVLLAVGSVAVAWGWPLWDVEASYLGRLLHESEPAAVAVQFAEEHHRAEEHHALAGVLALLAAAAGVGVAVLFYYARVFDPERLRARFAGVYRFLWNKWYFDEVYDAAVVRPAVRLAEATAEADKPDAERRDRIDPTTVDGLVSMPGQLLYALGVRLRALQSGQVRRYVLALVLTALALLAILSFFAGRSF